MVTKTVVRPQRTSLTLGGAASLMAAAMSVSAAAGTLQAGEQGPMSLAGAPATAGIVGTALGSTVVAGRIAARGPRAGVRFGYGAALLGAIVCAIVPEYGGHAVRLLGLVVGTLLLGVGNASAQLSRYVAADLNPPSRRGAAIALVVSVIAVGAVGGPGLLGPSGAMATWFGLPADSGPFLLAALCVIVALTMTAALPAGTRRAAALAAPAGKQLFARPGTRRAFLALAAAQVIMVAVMTAAPMNLHMHGTGTTTIGAIVSAHTFGMFALSPLTAVLIGRRGAPFVATTGLGLLALSSAATAVTAGAGQTIPLFLLGYAWNLCFVAGSTTLAAGSDATGRLAVEGRVDAIVWSFAAVAGLLSTVLLAAGGSRLLAGVAVLIAATAASYRTRKISSACR